LVWHAKIRSSRREEALTENLQAEFEVSLVTSSPAKFSWLLKISINSCNSSKSVSLRLIPFSTTLSESQRDSSFQPRVARHALPWVMRQNNFQPERGCITVLQNRRHPFRVDNNFDSCSQGSRCASTLGWMTQPRWG
jgi:hypothetical protein